MIAIETKNVRKTINQSTVLKNINIKLEVGSIYGIVGSNFSGRIELLKIISGFINNYEGEVKVLGKALKKENEYLDFIGTSFGTEGFIEEYTGLKNLKVIASIKGEIDEGDIKNALCMVGLLSLSREKLVDYDLEMKKKLSIAQAIMEKPKIIVIDEPFTLLQDEAIENISLVLKELSSKRKTTIILGNRNEDNIKDVCNHIYHIKEGSIEL